MSYFPLINAFLEFIIGMLFLFFHVQLPELEKTKMEKEFFGEK